MSEKIISIEELFTKILEINSPWKLSDIQLEDKTIKVFIDFEKGTQFGCPVCGSQSKVHDTNCRLWRHLDIADYKLYLLIKIPRIRCLEHGVKTIREIPWGRINTHYTHKFERSILHKAREMSVVAIAREVDETDKTLWNIIKYHIGEMKKTQINLSDIQNICVDETSSRKGHKHVTVFTDYNSGKVVFVTKGHDMTIFERFHEELKSKNINANKIKNISMDMSKSFICGAETYFSEAEITFDKFHLKKLLNEAVDKIRIAENQETDLLKKTKYL
jgi:transposase